MEELNKKINNKLKEIVDGIEKKYNCERGYCILIGHVYVDNTIYDLYLQFGYNKYYCFLNYNKKSFFFNDIHTYEFDLLPANQLCKDIKNLIKTINEDFDTNIKNKKDFLKLLDKK